MSMADVGMLATAENGSHYSVSRGEAGISMADVGQTASIPNSQPPEMETNAEQICFCGCCAGGAKGLSTKTLACGIGIIHGVAGPGGVLGVLPAVQLRDWKKATLYLGFFCISTTITMGCYAALYGTCSTKVGKERGMRGEYIMECFSSALSIIVGVLWLTLLACGKLEEVFP
jgi:predicted membrane protein